MATERKVQSVEFTVSSVDDLSEVISQTVARMHISTPQPRTCFSATMKVLSLTSEVELAHVVTDPASGTRTPQLIRDVDEDKLVFHCYTAGGSLGQFGREVVFGAGQGLIVDLTKPFVINHPRGTDTTMLQISRRALVSRTGGQLPVGVPIPAGTSVMPVLTRVAREAIDDGRWMEQSERDGLARVVLDLAGAVVRSLNGGARANPVGRGAQLRGLE